MNQLKPFEGEAKLEFLGVPANITVDPPKMITKDTKEIAFALKTNDKSPIGKHGGMFCQLTITKNGEPIVSRAGFAQVQINKPKPPKKPKVAAKPKPPEKKPVAKPAVAAKPPAKPAAKPAPTKPAPAKPATKKP